MILDLKLKELLFKRHMNVVKRRNRHYPWIYEVEPKDARLQNDEDEILPDNRWKSLIKRWAIYNLVELKKWLYSMPSIKEMVDKRNPNNLDSKRNQRLFRNGYELAKSLRTKPETIMLKKYFGTSWFLTKKGQAYINKELDKRG